MRLAAPGSPHLTYCTNIHPGESWDEVRANLERYVVPVKRRVAADRPFGVGLRLSAAAARTLEDPRHLDELRALLDRHQLYVFTINGFPYGAFHGTRVKEAVYLPDWLDEARLAYSDRLARLLAALLPADAALEGTVSTVPGGFRARTASEGALAAMADRMLRHAATLHRIGEERGRLVALALEPEPWCLLETVAETVAFFEERLFARPAVARFGALTGLPPHRAETALRRHVGVCLDACHMAVAYETPAASLRALAAAGIRVAKVQVSAGLEVTLDGRDRSPLEALRPFAESVYLHQVVERRGDRFARFLDLPDALAAAAGGGAGDALPREWRIHFHVPLFLDRLGPFANTQGWVDDLLAQLRREPATGHLEVETYTWDVLPEEYRREGVVAAVARELAWVASRMEGAAPRPRDPV